MALRVAQCGFGWDGRDGSEIAGNDESGVGSNSSSLHLLLELLVLRWSDRSHQVELMCPLGDSEPRVTEDSKGRDLALRRRTSFLSENKRNCGLTTH